MAAASRSGIRSSHRCVPPSLPRSTVVRCRHARFDRPIRRRGERRPDRPVRRPPPGPRSAGRSPSHRPCHRMAAGSRFGIRSSHRRVPPSLLRSTVVRCRHARSDRPIRRRGERRPDRPVRRPPPGPRSAGRSPSHRPCRRMAAGSRFGIRSSHRRVPPSLPRSTVVRCRHARSDRPIRRRGERRPDRPVRRPPPRSRSAGRSPSHRPCHRMAAGSRFGIRSSHRRVPPSLPRSIVVRCRHARSDRPIRGRGERRPDRPVRRPPPRSRSAGRSPSHRPCRRMAAGSRFGIRSSHRRVPPSLPRSTVVRCRHARSDRPIRRRGERRPDRPVRRPPPRSRSAGRSPSHRPCHRMAAGSRFGIRSSHRRVPPSLPRSIVVRCRHARSDRPIRGRGERRPDRPVRRPPPRSRSAGRSPSRRPCR